MRGKGLRKNRWESNTRRRQNNSMTAAEQTALLRGLATQRRIIVVQRVSGSAWVPSTGYILSSVASLYAFDVEYILQYTVLPPLDRHRGAAWATIGFCDPWVSRYTYQLYIYIQHKPSNPCSYEQTRSKQIDALDPEL